MLQSISIQTLGLINHAQFSFDMGLTSITGETGSGKTSLIDALKLALGKKSDFDLIKQGSSKASVVAIFDLYRDHPVYPFLHGLNIQVEAGEPLILKRILLTEGKSKAFINEQAVSLNLLQKIAPLLVNIIDQNALFELHHPHFYQELIDQSGGLEESFKHYTEAFDDFQTLEKLVLKQRALSVNKQTQSLLLEEEIKELEDAKILPDEEKTLFETYKSIQGLKQNLEKLEGYTTDLNQDVLPRVKKMKIDAQWDKETNELIQTAYAALLEISHTLESRIEDAFLSDSDILKMEERLKQLHRLKRKHLCESEDLGSLLKNKKHALDALYQLEDELIVNEETLKKMHVKALFLAEELSDQRRSWAEQLKCHLESHLRPLNMPYAELAFIFTKTHFGQTGIDDITLFMKANANATSLPLLQSASGGELARVNFCFFLERSPNSPAETYIFDEIDSHVGGVTSSLMGDKLQSLAQSRQVFCITHFPQMAAKGFNHLVFEKKQEADLTEVICHYSKDGPIAKEIERMAGVKE